MKFIDSPNFNGRENAKVRKDMDSQLLRIDRSCFRKTPDEKLALKIAKEKHKALMRKTHRT